MFAGLGKFWRDIMTESDGTTYCPVRIFGTGLITTHVGATVWQVIQHGTFDAVAFGTGSAALIAGLGGAIGAKAKLGAG
jgi:hypothetical protein